MPTTYPLLSMVNGTVGESTVLSDGEFVWTVTGGQVSSPIPAGLAEQLSTGAADANVCESYGAALAELIAEGGVARPKWLDVDHAEMPAPVTIREVRVKLAEVTGSIAVLSAKAGPHCEALAIRLSRIAPYYSLGHPALVAEATDAANQVAAMVAAVHQIK